jgi:hypothetical protein
LTEHREADKFIENGTFKDIPGYTEEKQTIIDEDAINESFEPATDAFSGFREFTDWLFDSISDFFSQTFGNLM